MITRRHTIHRMKILEYLQEVKTHPTAEVVYGAIKKELPTITLATVYRNLNILSQDRLISKLEINGEYHFDADLSGHQHCVCKICGQVRDNKQGDISKYAIEKVENKEFKADSVRIIYYGECCSHKCGENSKNNIKT